MNGVCSVFSHAHWISFVTIMIHILCSLWIKHVLYGVFVGLLLHLGAQLLRNTMFSEQSVFMNSKSPVSHVCWKRAPMIFSMFLTITISQFDSWCHVLLVSSHFAKVSPWGGSNWHPIFGHPRGTHCPGPDLQFIKPESYPSSAHNQPWLECVLTLVMADSRALPSAQPSFSVLFNSIISVANVPTHRWFSTKITAVIWHRSSLGSLVFIRWHSGPWDSSKVVLVTRSNFGVGNDIDAILKNAFFSSSFLFHTRSTSSTLSGSGISVITNGRQNVQT